MTDASKKVHTVIEKKHPYDEKIRALFNPTVLAKVEKIADKQPPEVFSAPPPERRDRYTMEEKCQAIRHPRVLSKINLIANKMSPE